MKHTHKFKSEEAAEAYFRKKGDLEYFGRSGGSEQTYAICNWYRWDGGKKYHVKIARDGYVEVEEFSAITYQNFRNK